MTSRRRLRRIALETLGWILVLAGVAALVLPGPGLLLLFAGLVVLSEQYDWAERRVEPIKVLAFRSAAESVQTWPRILASCAAAVALAAVGVLWGVGPDVPSWWPIADRWWLPGGWATGVTLIVSGVVALATIVWSYRRFHGVPGAEDEAERLAREHDDY